MEPKKRFLGIIKLNLTYHAKGLLLVMLMAALMLLATAVTYRALNKSDEMSKKVSRSLQITNRLKEVLNTLTDAETGERGYIITGNETFLKPYLAAKQKNVEIINAASLKAFMPEYAEEINTLSNLAKAKVNFVESIISAVKTGKRQQAVDITNAGEGRMLMDSIRSVISNIEILEGKKTNAFYNDESVDDNEIFMLLCSDVACCLLLLCMFYFMVLKNARLREKTEAKLLEAKNIAETADKTKTSFLALMSHQIRTPMHDIIATSALLTQTCITDEQRAHTNTIYRSSMALLAVVNDIIDFSHIENRKIPLENAPFILRDCLDEVFSAAGLSLTQKRTAYHIDENIPELIDCDSARLRQVLMSILGEKSKATENVEIGLTVHLLGTENNMMDLRFTIMNTIAGVFGKTDGYHLTDADAHQDKNNLFGISSLRFSIAARLISLMGGNIKLTDERNKGQVVTFSIKAKRVGTKVPEKVLEDIKHAGLLDNKMADRVPLNILVADDHEMNQMLMVQILAKMGYTCKTARNGAEAAGMAIETRFDIILMDIMMPVMDGIEATKRIREYYLQDDTPVIIGVTANALLKENKKGLDAGMNDFLIKPYKPIDIQHMIEKWASNVLAPKHDG